MLLRDILFADCEALHFVLRNIDAPVFAVVLFDILQEIDQLQRAAQRIRHGQVAFRSLFGQV